MKDEYTMNVKISKLVCKQTNKQNILYLTLYNYILKMWDVRKCISRVTEI